MENTGTGRTVCAANMCTGCMACVEKCAQNAISVRDGMASYNAVIDQSKCIECGACERVCPNNRETALVSPIGWFEGWASEKVRMASSSGGAASAIMRKFIEDGGFVAACLFENGEFIFDIVDDVADIVKFAGSKYVKSNPKDIYTRISRLLWSKDKVLFIGLPCQVAGLKNFVSNLPDQLQQNLYTIDLICHGTPSPQVLKAYLKEKKIDLDRLQDIRFRQKTRFELLIKKEGKTYSKVVPASVQDMYTVAFLHALDYTLNCYSCRYAATKRVSDVTLGDSWGSRLSDEEQVKGVSLLLYQTEKGKELVFSAPLELKAVDLENAVNANQQLRQPSIMPANRARFFSRLNRGFDKAISACMPKVYYKQWLKGILIRTGLLRNRSDG